MRIWSLHPKYLDTKGLVALWRETLLAKHVLEGRTKGYVNHPQLIRFKNAPAPVETINQYLAEIFEEASRRDYNFDKQKINWSFNPCKLTVTQGQLDYEVSHLLRKLRERDVKLFKQVKTFSSLDPHPLFDIIEGEIETWEVITPARKKLSR